MRHFVRVKGDPLGDSYPVIVDVVVAVPTDVVTLVDDQAAKSMLTGGSFREYGAGEARPDDNHIVIVF